MTAKSLFKGQPPAAKIEPAPQKVKLTGNQVAELIGLNPELSKYKKAWDTPDYRKWSPGEMIGVQAFTEAQPFKPGQTLIDFGCGTGRAGARLHGAGLRVTLVDFADNCLDESVRTQVDAWKDLEFIEHDLTKPLSIRADFGLCCDVMEHIPPDQVDTVLLNILQASKRVLFQIATVEDHFGKHEDIQAPLHLTVRNYSWWLKKFADFGCVIHRSDEHPNHVLFYVSAHRQLFFGQGTVNTTPEEIIENMRANAEFDIPQLTPHQATDREVLLLCGGPSLNDYWDEIKAERQAGAALVTVNGTYNAAIEHGLEPSLQFVIDAREFNSRFVEPLVDDCKYVAATQCHPATIAKLPPERSYFWQVTLEDQFLPVISELWGKQNKDWFPVPGGCTVGLRALCALQMLGYRKVHVYGMDSCLNEDEAHHAYEQAENDDQGVLELTVAGGTEHERTFKIQGWMGQQARDFIGLTKIYFQDMQLDIKGDGLIAYIIKTGAEAP